MRNIQKELKEWLLKEICKNNEEFEMKLRILLRQDKSLIKNMNNAYKEQDIALIQSMIKNYMLEKRVYIQTCKSCKKTSFFFAEANETVYKRKCEFCAESLFVTKKSEVETAQTEITYRACIYCGKPVSPTLNSMTCYSCKNVSFNVYDNNI